MNLNRAKADIATAKMGIDANPTNDEYLYDVAAYHAQQAIEKELKYLLHDVYGEDDSTKKFRTHNISQLLLMINQYDPDFAEKHSEIVDVSGELTNWEASTRYGQDLVSTREEIVHTFKLAEELLDEIDECDDNANVT